MTQPDRNQGQPADSADLADSDVAVLAPVATGTTRMAMLPVRERRQLERADAQARAPGHLLLLLLVFLVCYLIAAATGRSDIIQFSRARADTKATTLLPALTPAPGTNSSGIANGGNPGQIYDITPIFVDYYNQHNGSLLFGRPISPQMVVNGRVSQWFERARLEQWTQNAGTKYETQPALVGVEYTQGVAFPNQGFFVSNPQKVYSAVTNHGVSARFYQFWQNNGGLDMFGYPISDELQELLPADGKVHTVQYFERGRLELHPGANGAADTIMIGLIGRELYINDSAPNIISAAKPTPVPVP